MLQACEGLRRNGCKSFACTRPVQMHSSAEEMFRMKAAEDQVRICHGGALTAAITGRAGICACGLRSDLKGAGLIHPCERAAACAGGVDIEHGHADWQSRDLALRTRG